MKRRRNLMVRIAPTVKPQPAPDVERLDVVCDSDGILTVTADSKTLALIVGRDIFGDPAPVRKLLEDRIADAWYAADCPPASA